MTENANTNFIYFLLCIFLFSILLNFNYFLVALGDFTMQSANRLFYALLYSVISNYDSWYHTGNQLDHAFAFARQ